MTVQIEKDLTHEAQVEQVFAMMTDPAFVAARCEASGASKFTESVTADGDKTVVTVDRTMPTDEAPDLLKTFARNGVDVHEVITWGPADADGSRTAEIVLDFVGQPMAMHGTMHLAPESDGASLSVRAELKATIPLLGSKIEKMTAPLIYDAITSEETVGREWLARSS